MNSGFYFIESWILCLFKKLTVLSYDFHLSYHWTSLPKIYKAILLLKLKKRTRKTAKLSLLVFDTKAYYAVSLNVLFFLNSKVFTK